MSLKIGEEDIMKRQEEKSEENGAGAIEDHDLNKYAHEERPGTPIPKDISPNPLDMFAQLSLNSGTLIEVTNESEKNKDSAVMPPPPPPPTPDQHKLHYKFKRDTSVNPLEKSGTSNVVRLATAAAAAQPNGVSDDDEEQHVPLLALKAALELTKAKIDAAAKERREKAEEKIKVRMKLFYVYFVGYVYDLQLMFSD